MERGARRWLRSIGRMQAALQGLQLGEGLRNGDAGFERSHHLAPTALCLGRNREVGLDGLGMESGPPSRELEAEVPGQNAREGGSPSVHRDGAAHGVRVSAELVLEHVPGNHDSVLLSWAEKAPER